MTFILRLAVYHHRNLETNKNIMDYLGNHSLFLGFVYRLTLLFFLSVWGGAERIWLYEINDVIPFFLYPYSERGRRRQPKDEWNWE